MDRGYFKEAWNYTDISMIFLMFTSTTQRLIYKQNIIPSKAVLHELIDGKMAEWFFMTGLLQNLVLFFLLSAKVLFFLRIYPTFGIIVQMFLGLSGRDGQPLRSL